VLSMIAAVARNGVIGRDGGLPWRLPDELKLFRNTTLGKAVLIGRRTFESIGRPLDRRLNIVLTRDTAFDVAGCEVVHSVAAALELASERPELVVIGGAGVYAELLPRADRLYLTRVDADVEGDVHFPAFDLADWKETEIERHEADDRHAHAYTHVRLDRLRAT